MALTNAMLKAMGIEGDQRDQIMAAHQETLESIKSERDALQDKAALVPDLERQVEDLKAAQPTEDWEARYNAEHEAFEGFKAKAEAEAENRKKGELYRKLLREAGIEERRLDAIMKVTDLSEMKLDGDGLADADKLSEKAKEDYSGFIVRKDVEGANVPTPPNKDNGKPAMDPGTLKRLQERHERLYGKTETKEQE